MFKTYYSDHVYGFGKFFGIIATTTEERGVTAEIYLFTSDNENPIFDGIIEHIPDALVKEALSVVESQTRIQLDNLAYKYQVEAYNKNKDREIFVKNPVVFHEVENISMISLKQTPAQAENLRAIAKDTLSAPLREYINSIFSWEIEIRPYKKKSDLATCYGVILFKNA